MKNFEHINVANLAQAVQWLDDDAKPIAGGTDLLAEMKERLLVRLITSMQARPDTPGGV